jgi:hypothetical protein
MTAASSRPAAAWLPLLEAAYQLEGTDQAWLQRIAEAARPLLDRGLGVTASLIDASDPAHMTLSAQTSVGLSLPAWQSRQLEMASQTSPEFNRRAATGGALRSQHQMMRDLPADQALARAYFPEMRDTLGLVATDPGRIGVHVLAPSARICRPGAAERHRWALAAAHVAAAARLRRALRTTGCGQSDAIVAPGGKVEHAEGPAREALARQALRDAAVAIGRAHRLLARGEPDEGLGPWSTTSTATDAATSSPAPTSLQRRGPRP